MHARDFSGPDHCDASLGTGKDDVQCATVMLVIHVDYDASGASRHEPWFNWRQSTFFRFGGDRGENQCACNFSRTSANISSSDCAVRGVSMHARASSGPDIATQYLDWQR